MKEAFLMIAMIAFGLASAAQDNKTDASKEPKPSFEVNINGKVYKVSEEEELKLDSTISKPVISIKLSKYKKFENSAVAFEYPGYMAFEYGQDFGYKNWTFSGNNLVIMLFELDAKATLNSLVGEMVKKFGKQHCTTEDFEKELGHKKCKGKKLIVKLAGQRLTMDFYEIVLNDFKSRFIAFQDTITEDAGGTEECKKGFGLVDSTIVFKQ